MKSSPSQQGFTLIELVVVIVILGILAATALPRFVNLAGDARTASLQGLQGAITSAASIAYGTAAVRGQTGATGSISAGSATITLVNGYPDSETISDMLQESAGATVAEGGTSTTFTLQANCLVTYNEAASGAFPVITTTATGC